MIKILEEFKTKKLDISINILKKFENESLKKLFKNTFSVSPGEFKIIVIVTIIASEVRLKTRLKLFLINTPNIKILKMESVKKTSGNNIFKLLIIAC